MSGKILVGDRHFRNQKPAVSYKDAIRIGQQQFGYGAFTIDTGTRIPSREEQLGLEIGSTRSRRKQILDSL